jgi:hypothetical protein
MQPCAVLVGPSARGATHQQSRNTETNRTHLDLFGVQIRSSRPYFAAINRILIFIMPATAAPLHSWPVTQCAIESRRLSVKGGLSECRCRLPREVP